MRLVTLKNADGHKMAIDADFVAYIGPVYTPVDARNPNGPKSQVIGKSAVVMQNGTQFFVEGGVETVYGALRKGEGTSSVLVD